MGGVYLPEAVAAAINDCTAPTSSDACFALAKEASARDWLVLSSLVPGSSLVASNQDASSPHRSGSGRYVRELSFSDVPGRRLEAILHRSADPVRVAGVGLAGRACDAAATSVASVPEVWEPLGVAALGLAAADADEVEALWAGLERADHRGSDAQRVPRCELDDLLVQLGATGAGDDDVRLFLLAMSVAPGH